MITVKDFQKATEFPRACKDERGRLRVGAAVGTTPDTLERVAALREAGVDLVVVDTAHGHSRGVIETVGRIKAKWPDAQVIAGNIVTAEAARALVGCGRGWGEGRHRPGLHLHHPHRRRRRRAADLGGGQRGRSAARRRRARDRRRRHPFLRRHRQGDRGGRACGHDRRPVRRHRGVAGRGRALPGRFLQVLPRHGLARRDGASATARPTATSRTRPPSCEKLVPEGVEGRVPYKGSIVSDPAAARRRPARGDGLHRQRAASTRCARVRCSCASPTPACARATCTT